VFVIAPGEEFSNPTTVYEFAHGGSSPIATLSETGEGFGCAVDPKTGNLAVANSNDINNPDGKDYGDVAIFAGATGSPTMYYSSKFLAFYHCGYDNSGNLYVSGWESISSGYEFALASINAGSSSSIEPVTLNKKLYGNTNLIPGVQWDGKEMTVSSLTGLVSVYRLRISGQKATVTGTTMLRNPQKRQRGETYIQRNTITGVYYYHGRPYISFWPYPKGGKPSRVIRQKQWPSGSTLYGVTISVAPSRSRIHR
jgi:hypothetical protein